MRTIPMKENLVVEFKSDFKKYSDTDLVDEIVGMTNTKGGTLYLGVEDDGQITGVHQKHKDAIGVIALIAELLMITPEQAYSEIKKLVATGKLYKYCGGKYTKYKVK